MLKSNVALCAFAERWRVWIYWPLRSEQLLQILPLWAGPGGSWGGLLGGILRGSGAAAQLWRTASIIAYCSNYCVLLQLLRIASIIAYCFNYCVLLQLLRTASIIAYCFNYCVLLQLLRSKKPKDFHCFLVLLQLLRTASIIADCFNYCGLLQLLRTASIIASGHNYCNMLSGNLISVGAGGLEPWKAWRRGKVDGTRWQRRRAGAEARKGW